MPVQVAFTSTFCGGATLNPIGHTRHCRRKLQPRCETSPSIADLPPMVRVRKSLPAIIVQGSDRISFVNGMGTNALADQTKDPIQTVFTSNIGRCVDLVTAVQHEDLVCLLSSLPQGELYQYLDRYIFPADDVYVTQSSLPEAVDVMTLSPESIEAPPGMQVLPTIFGATVCQDDWNAKNMNSSSSAMLSEWAAGLGMQAHDESHWEEERIHRGIPKMGQDVTKENNPLEAGLWNQVSFEKGCYIGQETIARLNTYDGVKQVLCLMEFASPIEVGSEIKGAGEQDRAAGYITSVSGDERPLRALGYVRRKSGLSMVGAEITVTGVKGVIVDSPFLKSGYDNRSLLTL